MHLRQVLVDQGKGSVLQFSGKNLRSRTGHTDQLEKGGIDPGFESYTLRVHVRNLFDLQSSFQTGGDWGETVNMCQLDFPTKSSDLETYTGNLDP